MASIRLSSPGTRGEATTQLAPSGRFTATNASLRVLLKKAFGIRDFQIGGAPDWIDSVWFDIAAKTEGDRSVSEDQLQPLLQALLRDRFGFASHRESKELPVYLLIVGKNGPKLGEAGREASANPGVRLGGIGRLTGVSASLTQLAEMLSAIRLNGESILDRPALDETRLTGPYDFALNWATESIFTAVQEQLGLKLEARKAPVEMLVIERVERPSGN